MVILCDIGGSRMRFARKESERTISDSIIVDTPDSYQASIVTIQESVGTLAQGRPVTAIVGGIAGVLNHEGTQLRTAPNLQDWIGKPLVKDVARMTGARVVFKNDTDMTGLGEAVYGAGKEKDLVAYLTFSTGVGGSLIINKHIGPYTFGYEPGFQIINEENLRPLHDISGTALKEKYNALFRDIHDPVLRKKIMRAVIVGIHNTIVYWSPEMIVLGGGMTETFDLQIIHEELQKMPFKLPELPELRFAELGDVNGLYGALAYSEQMKGM